MDIHKYSEIGYNKDSKFFKEPTARFTELVGKRLRILDFENNISTKFGGNKMVMKIYIVDDDRTVKSLTGDVHMKKALGLAKKKDLLPIELTIEKSIDPETGKDIYSFKNYD